MKKYLKYLLLHAILILSLPVFAQTISVKGRVASINGKPLEGATITIKGDQHQATKTNENGGFQFSSISANSIMIVSNIGYVTQEFNLENRSSITIKLIESNKELNEVIIQAYGTTTRKLNTGNIAKVSSEEIETQPVSNPLAALEGRVAGLNINQSSGVTGSSFSVEIRGRTSLDQSLSKNDPLFVIDGVIFEPGNQPANLLMSAANNLYGGQGGLSPLNSINPSDIESIEVLKDADATAIYGSRGANGVILITTKKGKSGKSKITASVYSGSSKVTRTMSMLNTQQYIQMREEAFKNDGLVPSSDPLDAGYAPDIMLWDTTRYTDFKKLLIGNTAHTSDAQISLSGGNDLTQFFIGGGYHKETNVFSNSLDDIRGSTHFSITHNSENKKFNTVFSGGYSNDKNNLVSTDLTQYINMPPNVLLQTPDGKLNWEEAGVSLATVNNLVNPLAVFLQTRSSSIENLYGNLLMGYKVLPSLDFKLNLSYNTFRTDETAINPQSAIDPYTYSYITSSSSFANSFTNNWNIEPQLSYLKRIGDGKIDVLIGSSWQEKRYKATVIQASDFSSDLLLNNPDAAGSLQADINQSLYRYEAAFGRVNYNFKEKYLLNISFRRDGSSRFGPDKQFADFWALGSAWIFSEESFVKNNISFLSFGKIRGSYGVTGNDQIGDYKFMKLWGSYNTYQNVASLNPTTLYNPDFKWETNKKFEAAIELGFIKDRIFLSASYYRNRSSNQLINYPLPRLTGAFNVVENLPALVQNSGLEVVLTTKNLTGSGLKWSTSLNLTIPRNKLISFPGLELSSYNGLYVIGQSLSVINRYKYLGVDPESGIYTFDDVNKDGILNSSDYQVSGNTDPKFYGGILNTFIYHQFQLDFLFQFKKQLGQNYLSQLYNIPPGFIGNQPEIVTNRWQQPGDHTDIQQYTESYSSNAMLASNVYLNQSNGIYSDASFIRLKNISVSYSLPKLFLKKNKMSDCMFFISAQNLLTITRYIGMDPETQNFYVLPPLKTITAGIQISL
ncbi:MAG TPA: SusC/RagA family TonB-linked outer membrane protein [Hanamia sp.]